MHFPSNETAERSSQLAFVIPQEYAYDTLGRRTQLRTWATGEDW